MDKIIGNVVGVPNPKTDWNQTDPTKADYIKNKPTIPSIEGLATEDYVDDKVASRIDGIKTIDEQEHAKLGEELSTANGWTSDGWTGDLQSGFKHTSGNTNALSFAMPEDSTGKTYQVSFRTSVGLTDAPNLAVCIGDSTPFDLYGQVQPVNVGIKSINGGNLMFIPSADFTGTITGISIKEILGGFEGAFNITDSNGNEAFAIRTTKGADDPESASNYNGENNAFLGVKSGYTNTSGYGNVGLGALALKSNTSGFWNTGIGNRALEKNIVGSRNIALGYGALQENIYGKRNIAIGTYSLMYAENCSWNISIGADAQMNRTSGNGNVSVGFTTLNKNSKSFNTAIGYSAMYNSTTASYGVSVGWNAGYADAGSCNINLGGASGYRKGEGNNNIFIGHNAGRGGSSNYKTDNSVIIGHEAGYTLATNTTNNTIIGYRAGKALTSGSYNILIGQQVEADTPTGHYQLNIGNLLKGSTKSSDRYLSVNGGLRLPKIPTSDPAIAGAIWNDNGVLKVSVGE